MFVYRASSYRRNLSMLLGVIVGVTLLSVLSSYLVVLQAGEFQPLSDVVRTQHERNLIYGSGIHDVRRELKMEIIKFRQPEIVALGSSRPLDFRQEYFTQPFACACQAMDTLVEGQSFVDKMLTVHQPRVVIFALDHWWFTGVRDFDRDTLAFLGVSVSNASARPMLFAALLLFIVWGLPNTYEIMKDHKPVLMPNDSSLRSPRLLSFRPGIVWSLGVSTLLLASFINMLSTRQEFLYYEF